MNSLFNYTLKLADDSLIFGQRLSELCGKGPYLEEDIALTNISLDYLGQATNFYKYAAQLEGKNRNEDDLAYLRKEKEYLNCQLAEFPNGDYAQIILKVYLYSVYLKFLYEGLMQSSDDQLAALAEKSIKEVRYHYTHSSTWLKVFAKGNEESKTRINFALDNLWEYTGGMFDEVEGEDDLEKFELIPSSKKLYQDWKFQIKTDFAKYGLEIPQSSFMQKGSRAGIHTEYFGFILCELQYMQRAYPGCTW